MKKISIFLTIALMAIIYSCGNSENGSNEQNSDSLVTETAEQVDNESQITLTVKSGEVIKLEFSADEKNTQVKIVSGERDTSFVIGEDYTEIKYLSDDNTMTIYGNITKFYCDRNYTNLTGLDVSKNTNLEFLYCVYNNIKTLNIGQNKVITTIQCMQNQLTQLDVSNNKSLKTLYCGENDIISIDLSKNTLLENLSISIRKTATLNIDLRQNKKLKSLDINGDVTSSDVDKLLDFLPDRSRQEKEGLFIITFKGNQGIMNSSIKEKSKNKNWDILLFTDKSNYIDNPDDYDMKK